MNEPILHPSFLNCTHFSGLHLNVSFTTDAYGLFADCSYLAENVPSLMHNVTDESDTAAKPVRFQPLLGQRHPN